MKRAFALLAFVFAASLAHAADPDCTAPKGPAYVGVQDRSATSVVVFVHGVLSSASEAWSRGGTSWPCLLAREAVFASSNIYVYGYPTGLVGRYPSTQEVAASLYNDLVADDVFRHAHITIVAHSMGGLIVSRMLLGMQADPARQDRLRRVRLVEFFGTPATGADLASVAGYFSANEQFREISDPAELVQKWTRVDWPFSWRCVVEGRRTGWSWGVGVRVVSEESARALCPRKGQWTVLFTEDHVTMVKPENLQADAYRHLFRAFKACVASRMPAPDMEGPDTEALKFMQLLTGLRAQLQDPSPEAKEASLQVILNALYQSPAFGDQYFVPKAGGAASLLDPGYERIGARSFAIELGKLLRPLPAGLTPSWSSRVADLDRMVRDGRFIELRRAWKTRQFMADSDIAVAYDDPALAGTLLIVGGVPAGAAAGTSAHIRGSLLVPRETVECD